MDGLRGSAPRQSVWSPAIHRGPPIPAAVYRLHFTYQTLGIEEFGALALNASQMRPGSERLLLDGRPLVRDLDYRIDYDLGRVTLKRQLGPADQLNVDYSYAPLFQQAGRTLLGSAFRWEGRDRRSPSAQANRWERSRHECGWPC